MKSAETSQPFQTPSGDEWFFRFVAEKLTQINPFKKKFGIWRTQPYFEQMKSTNHEQVLTNLSLDLITTFEEYVAMKTKKTYRYGLHGVNLGGKTYHQTTSQRCRNFETYLESLDAPTTRAKLETRNAELFEKWLVDETVPIGAALVLFSPTGTRQEHYPGKGKDCYTFINVIEKTAANQAVFTQYSSFDGDAAHLETLDLLHNSFNSKYAEQPYEIPIKNRKDHFIIGQVLELQPGFEYPQIEEIIYRNKADWEIKLEDFPQFKDHAFAHQLDEVITDCLREFEYILQLPLSEAEKAEQYDQLIDLVKQWFLKWVEKNAENYKGKVKDDKPLEDRQKMIDAWRTQDKKAIKRITKSFKLDPRIPLARFASLSHCVVFTPSSLALNAAKLNLNFNNSLLLAQDISKLSAEEKSELTSIADNMIPIKVTTRSSGKIDTFYIYCHHPAKYAKDYADGCYRETELSEILGPCDIPLDQDELVDSDWLLSEEQYYALKAGLLEHEVADLVTEDGKHLSQLELIRLEHITEKICKLVFSVSITSLLAGSYEIRASIYDLLDPEQIELIKSSQNRLAALEMVVKDLETGYNSATSDDRSKHQSNHDRLEKVIQFPLFDAEARPSASQNHRAA